MAARRAAILDAARRCFARKGFAATTIADLKAESGLSTGGIYTHFPDKHAIVEALGSQLTEGEPTNLLAAYDHLRSDAGEEDARIDLHLWAEASADPTLHAAVTRSMDAVRIELSEGPGGGDPAAVALLEALALGLEVQRALGREVPPEARERLARILSEGLP